jgi:ABC-type multidrug transport system fused ATPase/permease subunit
MMDQFQFENMNFLIVRSAGNEGDHFSSLNTQGVSKNSVVVGASMSSNESYVSAYTYFYDYVTPWVAARNRYCLTNPFSGWCNRTFTSACCESGSPFYSVCCFQSKLDQMRRNSNLYNVENMVPSSSKGPTWDARIKPDVVAPGEYVTSARSDGDPNSFQTADPRGELGTMLLALSGTSMSTPLVAGAAAIIREYFIKGYYPSGRANPADGFEPSASLMKAMLITSARPLSGLDYEAGKWVQLPVRNSYYVGATFVDGFGAIALDRVLNFNSTNQNFQLVLPRTKDPTISMGEANSYCYDVVQPGLVTVSLVWTEHPGSPLTVIQLINNLDLIVMRSTVPVGGSGGDTVMLYGNMPFDRFGNVQNVGDVLNNVERLVNIPVNPGFSIRVNISGTNVPFRGQPYSVVVTSTYPPNFSPPYPGQALVPIPCSECFGSERSYCHIPNGNGQKRCVNGKWADCLVVSCNADYTVDAWQNRCKRFMQYYQVNLIASAGMGLIAAWFCLPFYIYDRRRVRRDERTPHAVSEAEAARREAGPWEMYTVVKPNLALVILGSLIGLGAQTSTLIQPLFVGKLIQQLNENVQWVDVRNTLFLVIMSAVAELLLGTISGWIMQVAEEANLLLLRHRLYETIMSQRYSFFERRDLGELQNRLVQDCSASVGFPSQFLSSLFGSLSRLIVALIMIFSISPHLSFVFLLMVPIFALIAYVFGRLIQPITVKQFDLSSKSATIAWDCLKNIRVVKAYGQIAQEIQRYKTATTESYDLNIKISVITTLAKLSNTSLTEAAAIIFLWYGSILVLEPRISTGLLLSFTLYVGYAVAGCSSIFNLWPAYKRTVGAMDKVFAILRLRTEPRPDDTPMKALSSMVADPKGIRGEMSLQNLSFHYEGHEHKMVIKRMNVEMKPGKLHIVTGPSGAGKSTFFNLLTRLYDPTSGSVIIDGSVDISTLRTIDLIAMISIIEQEPKIFNRTVQENLTYGSPETSDWRIEEISKLCNVHDFVIQLPEAYQTVIGEDSTGVRLSGGQKQRICMARALMKDCRVLLLDEPTNDLDIENEKLLLDIIYQLAKNKLVILITHHLNLIREHESVVYFMYEPVHSASCVPPCLRFCFLGRVVSFASKVAILSSCLCAAATIASSPLRTSCNIPTARAKLLRSTPTTLVSAPPLGSSSPLHPGPAWRQSTMTTRPACLARARARRGSNAASSLRNLCLFFVYTYNTHT